MIKKLAENLSRITKKLDEVNNSARKLSILLKQSYSENENVQQLVPVKNKSDNIQTNIKSLPNSSKFSKSMLEMLGSLMAIRISLKNTQAEFGQANYLGVPIQKSEGDRFEINDNNCDSTPEIYNALS